MPRNGENIHNIKLIELTEKNAKTELRYNWELVYVSRSVCLSLFQFLCIYVGMSVCICRTVSLTQFQSVCQSLSLCVTVGQLVYLSNFLSLPVFCRTVELSLSLFSRGVRGNFRIILVGWGSQDALVEDSY